MIALEKILAHVEDLPTLPDVVARLSLLISGDVWSAADFEEVVELDPALTANLLRLANSPYFGFSRKITSVRQAVTLMGIKRVFEVAASGAFSRVIPPHISGYDMQAREFWRHSIAVAIYSERLVLELGLSLPTLTFTAALLHDVGKLVIGAFLSQESGSMMQRLNAGDTTMVEVEHATLGTDHAQVGALVAKKWNLPEVVEIANQWHHRPNEVPADHQMLIDLIHTADLLAHSLGYGVDCGELSRRLDPEVAKRLTLTPMALERVAVSTFDQIQSMSGMFGGGGKKS